MIPDSRAAVETADVAPAAGLSVNRRIFRAAASVTVAGALVKIVATIKEFVVAGIFGRSNAMDAFLIALLLPNLLVNLFAESMNQALIPTLVRVREKEGEPSARRLLQSAMAWSSSLLAGGALAMALGAHWVLPLVAQQFSPEKLALTERLFYGLLPVVVIAGVASNCTAVLNTFERFAWPALAPMATPLVLMGAAWLASPMLGISALVWGNVAGAALHAGLTIWMMERHGYPFRLRWNAMTPAAREVAGQYGPVLLSGLVASSGLLVDQAMAAALAPGSVSTLVYANRFVSVAVNLLAGAIATAVTPYISQMVAQRDWAGCRHTLNTYARLTAMASIPVGLVMVFGSHWLIRLTFQHGAFTAADTAAVAPVQAMYAVQLPFFIVSRVYYRYLVAIRRTGLILWCGSINLVLDVVLNLVLMRWMGVAGIALATSLWTVSTFVFLAWWSYRLLPPPESGNAPEAVA